MQVMIIVAMMASTASELAGQARISGIVRDTTGAPIAGVEVSATGTTRTETTDRSGAFQLEGLPAGTAQVTLRRVGYSPQTTIMKLVDGDNSLGEVVLTVTPRELDTVRTSEQELYRDYPLLREFDANRKVGLGQFVTRQQLEMQRGGFMTPILTQLRGVMMIRSATVAQHAWIANSLIPTTSCTVLEDLMNGEQVGPVRDAACHYCYPAVYLDNALIAPQGVAANVGRFSPDQLEAVQVYLGDAETPAKYINARSGCGVIVLHSRVVQVQPRIYARQDHPTRSRLYLNAAVSAGKSGSDCTYCGSGTASDFRAGYTFRDRWVLGVRAANWSGNPGGFQSIKLRQGFLEWYPHPDPGRFKWFITTALGNMNVDVYSEKSLESSDRYVGSGLPSMALGTGMDVSVVRRFVVTPFISYNRNLSGYVDQTHCVTHIPTGGSTFVTDCVTLGATPHTFSLLQLGTRVGWR
jgi:hypothetical protein